MYYILMFQNRNCHKKSLFRKIGVGIIAIVVFPRDAKIVDMKFVYLIKHMLTFIL